VDAIYPDQWLSQRVRRALGVSWARQRGRVASSFLLPLRFANELIFVLRQSAA
jgi:hypothetical protein